MIVNVASLPIQKDAIVLPSYEFVQYVYSIIQQYMQYFNIFL